MNSNNSEKKIAGIIVEYNPFHKGHAYHIEQTRKATGASFIVAVMSGNFTQRGIPAIIDKYTRTEMALLEGADVVYELPSFYAVSSAESFAYGAVSLLNQLGNIDYLCYGAENPEDSQTDAIVDILLTEPEAYKYELKKHLASGKSYPVARQLSLLNFFPKEKHPSISDFLSTPNNILGIEYQKSLKKVESSIKSVVIKRQGLSYHDTDFVPGQLPSASALRNALNNKDNLKSLKEHLPNTTYDLVERHFLRSFPINLDDFSEYMYYRLWNLDFDAMLSYPDVTKDLAARIYRLRNEFKSISQFSSLIKTRQFTLTRIQRVLLHLLLDLKEAPPSMYARLLGFRRSSSCIIDKEAASIPIITKPADYKELLAQDIHCTELYNRVLYKKYSYEMKNDLAHPLVIL